MDFIKQKFEQNLQHSFRVLFVIPEEPRFSLTSSSFFCLFIILTAFVITVYFKIYSIFRTSCFLVLRSLYLGKKN